MTTYCESCDQLRGILAGEETRQLGKYKPFVTSVRVVLDCSHHKTIAMRYLDAVELIG